MTYKSNKINLIKKKLTFMFTPLSTSTVMYYTSVIKNV